MARFMRSWFREREREAARVFASIGLRDGEWSTAFHTDIFSTNDYAATLGANWASAPRGDNGAGVLRLTATAATATAIIHNPGGNLGVAGRPYYFAARMRVLVTPVADSRLWHGMYAATGRVVGVNGVTAKFVGGEVNAATGAVVSVAQSTVSVDTVNWHVVEGWSASNPDTVFNFRVDGEPWVQITGLNAYSGTIGRLPWLFGGMPAGAVSDSIEIDKYILCGGL